MSNVECPICHTEYDESIACPRCSFEKHQSFLKPGKFQDIEEKRISAHSKWWKELQDKMVDRSEYNKKEQELMELNSRISELEQTLASRDADLSALQKELDEVKEKCGNLKKEHQSLTAEISKLNTEKDTLNNLIKEKDELIIELEKEIERLKSLIPNEPFAPTPNPPSTPAVRAYLIQKEYGEISNVYPIYKGKTFVGKKPQSNEESANLCALVADSKEIQETHFSIETFDDGRIVANRIGDNWGIDYEGNNIKTSPLQNETQIYIGKQLQLIVIWV